MKLYQKLLIVISALFSIHVCYGNPRCQNDTISYNVHDFGVVGDGETDDLNALNKLIQSLSQVSSPVKLNFNGECTYRLDGRTTDQFHRIFVNRCNNLVLDGRGCTLLVHPSARAFAVYRSNGVTIRNFNLDYSPLPYTQGRVTKVDPTNYYLEFVVDENYPLPKVADETYYKGGKMVDCITANGQTRKFYQGHSWVKRVTDLGNRKFGVKYALRKQEQLKINDFFCMKITYPIADALINTDTTNKFEQGEWMYSTNGSIEGFACNHILLDNITSFASPLMTIVLKGCSDHTIKNLSIKSKADRIVAGCSDGMHLKGNENQPVIENCYIERTMDDAIHIKMSGDDIKEVYSDNKFRIQHKDNVSDNTQLNVGKEIMLFNLKTLKQEALCHIINYEPINSREGIVTIDQQVPTLSTDVCVYLQAKGKARISHCTFGTQLQRAILCHQPTIVSDCSIIDNGKGFDLALMSRGIEGPPTQSLWVENCLFKNLSNVGLSVNCPSLDYDQKGSPQLMIKNCIFDMPAGIPVLNVKNSQGVSLINNTFILPTKKINKNKLFKMENSVVLENKGNIFVNKINHK